MQNENRSEFAEYQKLSDGYAELEQILRSPDLDLPLRITHLWPGKSNKLTLIKFSAKFAQKNFKSLFQ